MKFLAYFALIATTAAVRLQSTTEVQTEANLWSEIELEKHIPSPEEVWDHFDKNGDGEWDLKEAMNAFKGTMQYFGHKMPKGWKKMVASEFKKVDKDGSGKVSAKEMLSYMFDMIDQNDDGKWQPQEVFDAIEALAKFTKNKLIKGWKKHVADAFEHVDTDNDGAASGKEVMAALKKYGFPNINDLFEKNDRKITLDNLIFLDKRVPSPQEVWEHFDKNGDGEWDLKEATNAFKGAMEYFGHKLPKGWKKMVAAEFKKADEDGSGKVSAKEMMVYIYDAIDSNDDGVWDLDEVKDAIRAIAKFSGNTLKKGWEGHVEQAFKTVDANSDGKATGKEVMAALKKYGVPDINDLFN